MNLNVADAINLIWLIDCRVTYALNILLENDIPIADPFFVTYVGLNIEIDRILEIACVITDGSLTKSIEVISISLFQLISMSFHPVNLFYYFFVIYL